MIKIKSVIKIKLQKIRRLFYIIMYKYYSKKYSVDKNKILFLSNSRSDMSGNFEFVYNELLKDKNKYLIKWYLKNDNRNIKSKFSLSYDMATSNCIFVDDFYPLIYAIKLRSDTQLVQLWHAMGAFKKVGYSRNGNKSLTHRGYTGAIVSSESIRKDYADAYDMDIEKVRALGIPRTDIFFDKNYEKNIKKKIYDKYPMLKNKKVILFAPTFRGNNIKNGYYDFELIDFQKLKDKLKDEYVCIIKLHPFIKNRPLYDFEDDDFYLDLTSEREINDLLFVTDVLITDYSSVIFEYSFFERPAVFFVPDLDDYRYSRDFYYSLDKYTYGEIAKDENELINCIKSGKVDKKKLKEFKKYFCSACTGNSSKNVVDYFIRKK